MPLIGDIGSEDYQFFRITVKACQETEELECADKIAISKTAINYAMQDI